MADTKTDDEQAQASAGDESHCEHCSGHHERLTIIEKALGLHKEPDDMRSETERHADHKHAERERRDEGLARRKRS